MKDDVRYCLDCGWRIRDDEYGNDDPSALMIDHTVATGHDLDSCTEGDTRGLQRSSSARPRFWEEG